MFRSEKIQQHESLLLPAAPPAASPTPDQSKQTDTLPASCLCRQSSPSSGPIGVQSPTVTDCPTQQGESESSRQPTGPSIFGRPLSPRALTEVGKDWELWLRDLQREVDLLRGLDAETLNQKRLAVAAHILKIKQKLNDEYGKGLKNVADDLRDFGERAGFHYAFFSKAYISRLALSLVFFFLSAYICALASMCTGYRTPRIRLYDVDGDLIRHAHTLPDIGHDIWASILAHLGFPYDYIPYYALPDLIAWYLGTLTMLFVLSHPRRFLIIRRTGIIFAILFLFRSFTVTITSLPDASPTCLEQWSTDSGNYKREPMFPNVLFRAAKFVVRPTSYVTCGDMIFSGHSTVLVMCALIFGKYCRGKLLRSKVIFRSFHISEALCTCVRQLVYLVATAGTLIIIGTRLHYTLDVAIAVYLTQRTFRFYHHLIDYPNITRKYAGGSIATLLQWLENEDIIAVDSEAYELVKSKT